MSEKIKVKVRTAIEHGNAYYYPHCGWEVVEIKGREYLRPRGEEAGATCFERETLEAVEDADLLDAIAEAESVQSLDCDECPFFDDCSLDALDQDWLEVVNDGTYCDDDIVDAE